MHRYFSMNKREALFVETVLTYYKEHGRYSLPWRQVTDPYLILVSEIMLQQTQVDRVIPKYQAFIERWPTAEQLALASLRDVLIEWQGLGYNRRAKYLHECAKAIVNEYQGTFPASMKELQKLPGIGAYTAGAIMAFAYNISVPLIETNVRTVFIHHFFKREETVTDEAILRLVARTLPTDNPRQWYAALMDYGTYLKQTLPPVHRKSAVYKKQSTFKGSNRQLRGMVVRLLLNRERISLKKLVKEIEHEEGRVISILNDLEREGLVTIIRGQVALVSTT